jgi:hypothetical protein
MRQFDPKATFRFEAMNGRKAPESGRRCYGSEARNGFRPTPGRGRKLPAENELQAAAMVKVYCVWSQQGLTIASSEILLASNNFPNAKSKTPLAGSITSNGNLPITPSLTRIA